MKELRFDIHINAPPEKVWKVLTENGDWGSWNPFVKKVLGKFEVGQRLTNTLELPGQKPMTFSPRVLKAEPAKELRWLGRILIPGIFDGEHYFLMEADAAGTRFTHGEIFKGLLIGILDMKKTEEGFKAFNEGLKKKVEGQ